MTSCSTDLGKWRGMEGKSRLDPYPPTATSAESPCRQPSAEKNVRSARLCHPFIVVPLKTETKMSPRSVAVLRIEGGKRFCNCGTYLRSGLQQVVLAQNQTNVFFVSPGPVRSGPTRTGLSPAVRSSWREEKKMHFIRLYWYELYSSGTP